MKAFRTLMCLSALTTILLSVAATLGQDKQGGTKGQGGKANPGQEFMEKFVGDWDVVRVFYGPGTGEPARTKGTCKQTIQYGGKFLVSEFTFGEGESKTTGQGLMCYVPETGLYQSNWIDSRQTKMSVRQSKDKFNGKFVELATIPYKLDKSARASRTVTTFEEDGKKILHGQWNMLDTGEKLWMELLMTRK